MCVKDLLVTFAVPHLRARRRMPLACHSLLHAGATSNESLHYEINQWFKQTQKLHQATLELKLHILQFSKLLTHNAALYRPTPAAGGPSPCACLHVQCMPVDKRSLEAVVCGPASRRAARKGEPSHSQQAPGSAGPSQSEGASQGQSKIRRPSRTHWLHARKDAGAGPRRRSTETPCQLTTLNLPGYWLVVPWLLDLT